MTSQIRIDMMGKLDKDGHKYYVTTSPIPASLDLNNAVVFIFPWVEGEEFGAEMIVKHRSIQNAAHRAKTNGSNHHQPSES